MLGEAVGLASGAGIVRAGDHIVVVQMVQADFVVKIVSVDDDGETIAAIRPKSLLNIVRVSPQSLAGPRGIRTSHSCMQPCAACCACQAHPWRAHHALARWQHACCLPLSKYAP